MHGPRTVVLAGDYPFGPSSAAPAAIEKLRSARQLFHDRAQAPQAVPLAPAEPCAATPAACASPHGSDAACDIAGAVEGVAAACDTVGTGFDRLDAELPGGGWPCRALTELLLPPGGAGELRLLAPALRAALHAGRTVMLFDPPPGLTARSLARLGLDADHLLVIEGHTRLLADAGSLWALEQALKSGHVGAVVAWLPPGLAAERLRPLQLAAQRHDGPAFVMREAAAAAGPTAAPLRLALHPHGDDGLTLRLLKRRPPASAGLLRLALPPLPAVAPALAAVLARARVAQAPAAVPQAAATETTASATLATPQGTASASVATPSQISLFAPGRLATPVATDARVAPPPALPVASFGADRHPPSAKAAVPARSCGAARTAHPPSRLQADHVPAGRTADRVGRPSGVARSADWLPHSAVFVDLAA